MRETPGSQKKLIDIQEEKTAAPVVQKMEMQRIETANRKLAEIILTSPGIFTVHAPEDELYIEHAALTHTLGNTRGDLQILAWKVMNSSRAYVIKLLWQYPWLLQSKRRDEILKSGSNFTAIATGCYILKIVGIFTDENEYAVIQAGEHADKVARGLCSLSWTGMSTLENRNAVARAGRYAKEVAAGLCILKRLEILTGRHRDAVSQAGEFAQHVAEGIFLLEAAGNSTDKNLATVAQAGSNAKQVARELNVAAPQKIQEKNALPETFLDGLFSFFSSQGKIEGPVNPGEQSFRK